MAKERRHRYGSTSDMLLDLEAVAAGEPPLQARKQFDAGALTGLAEEAKEAGPEGALTEPLVRPGSRNLNLFLVVLGVALALSVLFNLLLIVLMVT
jgi:FAD/FMN-containing dehydrogenase